MSSPAPVDPPLRFSAYRSSVLRAPTRAPLLLAASQTELTAPVFGHQAVDPAEADLTVGSGGEPLGERIVVSGRVLDADGRPVPATLVEIWQANAGGRYRHPGDRHPAPLDPYFVGAGRCLTDAAGGYRFVTIRPGAYPWANHHNAWRPAHIHFSVFGPGLASRLVTQMYFPGDPLLPHDPIFGSVPDPHVRARLVAAFDLDTTVAGWALGYRWDIVLRGRRQTPWEG